ncbi:hypothetical protein JCM19233_4431 [Vibrio astriarenae]|nr:hypothetical protein JCM19233_4431 [Vibrio sp. C7]
MLKSLFGFALLVFFIGYFLYNGSRAVISIHSRITADQGVEQLITQDVQVFFADQIKN